MPGADGISITGPQGLPGADGISITGPQGLPGADGISITGPQGLPGADGISITGPQGGAGADGARGIQGLPGADGVSITGPQGVAGPAGSAGVAGLKGDTGLTGITGKGFTIYATYSSETLLVADDLHIGEFVLITGGMLYLNKGISQGDYPANTAFHFVGDITNDALLVGPQGLQGLQGLQGIQGVAGVAGSAGVAGTVGPAGTSITGPQGLAGQSAIDYSTYGQNWVSTGLSGTTNAIAMSGNGKHQTITGSGKIYQSTDCGVNWITNTAISGYGIGMDSTGQYQSVGTASGIYYSSNLGVNWTASNLINSNMAGVVVSPDGVHQMCTSFNNAVYYSSDYGHTWNTSGSPLTSAMTGKWVFLSISNDKYATMCIQGGLMYNSTTYGVSWTASTILASAITTYAWQGCAMSSSGQYQVACVNNGGIYYSSNYGLNWVLSNAPSLAWGTYSTCTGGITMSANGQFSTVMIPSVGMYSSMDYGHTWAKTPATNLAWNCIVMSSTGQYQSATNSTSVYYSSGAGSILNSTPAVLYNSITTASGTAYTLDYNVGATNILANAPTANFSIRLNNCVASTTSGVFTITYNTVNKYYCNSITCYDTSGVQIVLASSVPLFVGGSPTLTSSTIIQQTFTLIRNFASNYVLSSVASYY